MPSESDFDTIHNITPGRHLYQFYKREEDYLRIILPFFQAGLEKGEACLWLVSQKMGVERMRWAAERAIPHFSSYLISGEFTLYLAEDWYLEEGSFSEERAMKNVETFIGRTRQLGFSQVRGAGDAGCVPSQDMPYFQIYEKKVSGLIKTSSTIALCAYPILDCTLNTTKAVLEAHDDVLVGHL